MLMEKFSWGLVSRFRSEIMGVAIVCVLVCHCGVFSWGTLQPCAKQLAPLFAIGVDMFLFVSGVGLWFSMKSDGNVLRFWRRRFLRVVPEYLAVAGVSYAVFDVASGADIDGGG